MVVPVLHPDRGGHIGLATGLVQQMRLQLRVEKAVCRALVDQKLGKPDDRAMGRWTGTNRFDSNCIVWYYKDKGRVVIDGYTSCTVVTSEADPSEDGRRTSDASP